MPDRLPPPRFSWGRLSKTAAFWMIVILIPVVLVELTSNRTPDSPEIVYNDFMRELQRGNVNQVEILDGQEVHGDFKTPVRFSGHEAMKFTMLLPFPSSESFVKSLDSANVPVRARRARQGLVGMFLQLLPWLILIAFWLFMFRQMQAGGSRAFAFGKSKAKLLTGDTPKITFVDVAGADEAKVELQEII